MNNKLRLVCLGILMVIHTFSFGADVKIRVIPNELTPRISSSVLDSVTFLCRWTVWLLVSYSFNYIKDDGRPEGYSECQVLGTELFYIFHSSICNIQWSEAIHLCPLVVAFYS